MEIQYKKPHLATIWLKFNLIEYTNQQLKNAFDDFIETCNVKLQLISLEVKLGIHPTTGATYLTMVNYKQILSLLFGQHDLIIKLLDKHD